MKPDTEAAWFKPEEWLHRSPWPSVLLESVRHGKFGKKPWLQVAIRAVSSLRNPVTDRLDPDCEAVLRETLQEQGTPDPDAGPVTIEGRIYERFGVWVLHDPEDKTGDWGFTPGELATINKTLEQLPSEHLRRGVVRMILRDPRWWQRHAMEKLPGIARLGSGGRPIGSLVGLARLAGLYQPDPRIVRIVETGDEQHLANTVAHEVGHGVFDHYCTDAERQEFRRLHEASIESLGTAGLAVDWDRMLHSQFELLYGATNPDEDFATVYAALHAGPRNNRPAPILSQKRRFVERLTGNRAPGLSDPTPAEEDVGGFHALVPGWRMDLRSGGLQTCAAVMDKALGALAAPWLVGCAAARVRRALGLLVVEAAGRLPYREVAARAKGLLQVWDCLSGMDPDTSLARAAITEVAAIQELRKAFNPADDSFAYLPGPQQLRDLLVGMLVDEACGRLWSAVVSTHFGALAEKDVRTREDLSDVWNRARNPYSRGIDSDKAVQWLESYWDQMRARWVHGHMPPDPDAERSDPFKGGGEMW